MESKASFTLNIAARKLKLLAGDKINISNRKQDYFLSMPGVSYSIYKVVY